jgi:hypothetical protein
MCLVVIFKLPMLMLLKPTMKKCDLHASLSHF